MSLDSSDQKGSEGGFAFSLSARKAARLRNSLAKGKVYVKAEVSVKVGEGEMGVVTGRLPGTDLAHQEVLIIAHLCHPRPGANDNASGCGLGMEIARTISSLIKESAIPQPRRSIRFLFVPEMYGTVAYIDAHPDWPKSVVAGVNLDMVGEDQEATGACFIMTSTPWSCPGAVNDLASYFTQKFFNKPIGFDPSSGIPIKRYSISGYSGGSDHYILVDPTVGIPTVFLGHWPDRFYHSNMDTIDKTDPQEFKLAGLVAASCVMDIANFNKDRARFTLSLVESGARFRIWNAVLNSGMRKLDFLMEREIDSLRSILNLLPEDEVNDLRPVIDRACEDIRREVNYVKEGAGNSPAGGRDENQRSRELSCVPVRRFRAPLDMSWFFHEIGRERADFYRKKGKEDVLFSSKLYEFINWMDSKRTISEIMGRVSAEFGDFDEDDALRFLDDLLKLDLIGV